jgi:carboxypeptidase T
MLLSATASSQHGIDLNRNDSFKYGGAGTSTAACNLTYRGTGASSEPETQGVQSWRRARTCTIWSR